MFLSPEKRHVRRVSDFMLLVFRLHGLIRSTKVKIFCSMLFALFLIMLNIASGIIDSPLAYAAPKPSQIQLKGDPSTPNKIDPKTGSTSVTRPYKPAPMGTQKTGEPQTIPHNVQMAMKPGSVALQVNQSTRFVGSDGRLELQISAGAISVWDLAQAGGTITLHVTQVAPASGSNAGGLLSLGTYLLQLQDAQGKLLTYGLLKPITATYHLQKNEQHLGLNHPYALFNAGLSSSVSKIQGTLQPATGTALSSTLGALQKQSATLDTNAQTLTVVTPLISTPSTSLSWNSDASIASFGKPNPFSVGLSAGGLTNSEPINVPAGPGGLTPPISLTYNSESVNGQHSYSSAAGWVGEGWNLSLGEITWDQHNVVAGCTPQPSCGSNWQNQWFLNDAYGTSSELIPPNVTASTYYDATSNTACQLSSPSVACPILWHTANESHAKIYAYVGPNGIPSESINPVCWRVFLPNGIMEEFGCTTDSLQYLYVPGGHAEVNGWFLDMITDPQGNQIHLTYQRDMENWTDPTTRTTYSYPRDVELSTISYDSPGCLNAQTMCTGNNWAPQMQVVFNAGHGIATTPTGGIPAGCNTGSNLRCDDPVDLSGSGGTAAPLIQNTYVLNNIQVQVRTSGMGSWNTLHSYLLGYEQTAPSTITDPASGMRSSVAGMLDLTQFQEMGSPGANALRYSGKTINASTSYAFMKVFDLSSQNIVIGPTTSFSYWIYPQGSATNSLVTGNNSTCVALDLVFTDGTTLHNLGAVDQHGNGMHPANQCGHPLLDQWNQIISNIGAVANGKTISRLDVGYDGGAPGGYRGAIDDISLANPTSNAPLFATGFESGDPQPTWSSTVDGSNIVNVGGICCGLTGPESWAGQIGLVHTDSAALPQVTFTYTGLTNYYEDSFFKPNPSSNCGPSWNTGNGSGCLLWEQSYANSNRYLSSVSNGQGLAQSFSWMLARNNSHGVPGGGSNNADPFYCDNYQTTSPCQEADDSGWSHVVLSSQSNTTLRLTQNGQGGTQTTTPITSTTGYTYKLTYPLTAQQCSDCVAGMYWGDQNDNDYLSYYNGIFMGFAQTTVNEPSGAVKVHKFYAGEGWGIYDTSQVTCYTSAPCHKDPWWDLANTAHGREYQSLSYDTDGSTLLTEQDTTYQATCPPTGVSATPANGSITWDGKLISDLDHNNPVAVCDIKQTQQVGKTYDGSSSSVTTTTNLTYDNYDRVTQETTTSNGGTPSQVVKNTSYVQNDNVTATKTSATGTYIINTVASTNTQDGSGNRLQCSYFAYDGLGYTQTPTAGLLTLQDNYSNCGTSSNGYSPSGQSRITKKYDAYGNLVGTTDADANAGISGHTGCSVNDTAYTTCTAYDSTFAVFPTSTSNALNQTSSTSYANTSALYGYGTWPTSSTDANGQTTSMTYDSLGRMTSETLPGETSGLVTKQWVYTNWCAGQAAQSVCEEIDEIDRLNSTTTTTTRAFYDGEGRLVETRTPGPVGQDVVIYAFYDSAGRQLFKSDAYFVTAYTGLPGLAAYAIPDTNQSGTTTNYEGSAGITTLRTTSVTDPNSYTSTTTESVVCGVPGTSDTGCYVQEMAVDANSHETATLTGALGYTNYSQRYTGNSSSTYALYATTATTYDAAGQQVTTVSPDGTSSTMVYDTLGDITSTSDPDRGTTTFTYDANGNVTESVDARGTSGTVYIGYDGLNRQLWHNSTNSSSNAWVLYTYDSTASGNAGIGRLTGESFTGSGGLTGSYAYTYDGRGQQTAQTTTVNSTAYTLATAYDDAGSKLTLTYPTGEVVSAGRDANGWQTGLTTTTGSTTTTLASNLSYTGLAGAVGHVTNMNLDNGTYAYAASFDSGLRLTSSSLTLASSSTLLEQSQPTYDAVNNVLRVQTSINSSTDTQQFCYDALNRLTWSGTNGIPPCASNSIVSGTLTSAAYQQTDTYNVDGGLTTGLVGTYTYGNTSHPHALTATSSGYSAAYDAMGNMTCRAISSSTTCSGTQTGQQLSYDAQGRLKNWQNAPGSPTSTASYLYDGSGQRVAQLTTVSGTTSLTAYIGSIEEVTTTGSTTHTTTFYTVDGKRMVAQVDGTWYYFGYDALGSQVVVLTAGGTYAGSQLYGPYGNQRYSNGSLPTTIGFTGQRADSVTGLDYYVARYYDPVAGSFLTADTIQGNTQGFDPYAYVSGNPETETDPSGTSGLTPIQKYILCLLLLCSIGESTVPTTPGSGGQGYSGANNPGYGQVLNDPGPDDETGGASTPEKTGGDKDDSSNNGRSKGSNSSRPKKPVNLPKQQVRGNNATNWGGTNRRPITATSRPPSMVSSSYEPPVIAGVPAFMAYEYQSAGNTQSVGSSQSSSSSSGSWQPDWNVVGAVAVTVVVVAVVWIAAVALAAPTGGASLLVAAFLTW